MLSVWGFLIRILVNPYPSRRFTETIIRLPHVLRAPTMRSNSSQLQFGSQIPASPNAYKLVQAPADSTWALDTNKAMAFGVGVVDEFNRTREHDIKDGGIVYTKGPQTYRT